MRMVKDFDRSLFELGEGFRYGKALVPMIDERMAGRCLGSAWDMGVLAQAVYNEAGKDYLEIGSYFGGSLIVAGLMSGESPASRGRLVSVDAYAEDYPWRKDEETGLTISPALLHENVQRFGLEVDLYQQDSAEVDWASINFQYNLGVVYVDGGHDEEQARHDITIAMALLPEYVVVDNVDKVYPHIWRLVTHKWPIYKLVHLSGITAVLERIKTNG